MYECHETRVVKSTSPWRTRVAHRAPQPVLLQLGSGHGSAEAALEERRGVLPRDSGAAPHRDRQPAAHVSLSWSPCVIGYWLCFTLHDSQEAQGDQLQNASLADGPF